MEQTILNARIMNIIGQLNTMSDERFLCRLIEKKFWKICAIEDKYRRTVAAFVEQCNDVHRAYMELAKKYAAAPGKHCSEFVELYRANCGRGQSVDEWEIPPRFAEPAASPPKRNYSQSLLTLVLFRNAHNRSSRYTYEACTTKDEAMDSYGKVIQQFQQQSYEHVKWHIQYKRLNEKTGEALAEIDRLGRQLNPQFGRSLWQPAYESYCHAVRAILKTIDAMEQVDEEQSEVQATAVEYASSRASSVADLGIPF